MTLTSQFKDYLTQKNLSKISIKNYLADVNKFLKWNQKFGNSKLEAENFKVYLNHLQENQISPLSFKRYLSSLRQFGQFLVACGKSKSNAAEALKSITLPPRTAQGISFSILIDKYGKYLSEEKLSPATVKNYLADTRQFLNWLKDKGQNYGS